MFLAIPCVAADDNRVVMTGGEFESTLDMGINTTAFGGQGGYYELNGVTISVDGTKHGQYDYPFVSDRLRGLCLYHLDMYNCIWNSPRFMYQGALTGNTVKMEGVTLTTAQNVCDASEQMAVSSALIRAVQ